MVHFYFLLWLHTEVLVHQQKWKKGELIALIPPATPIKILFIPSDLLL